MFSTKGDVMAKMRVEAQETQRYSRVAYLDELWELYTTQQVAPRPFEANPDSTYTHGYY